MVQPTCFVISPIGKAGSETRKAADDLFELILEPALEHFGFDVIRADKIPGAGVITNDIISLLQSAELCVIDLSEPNPNVYYECGRRHETARPYIQLSRSDEIPFDLAGIRTIHYDLTTPRSVYQAVQEIRRYVEEYRKTGFSSESSGGSLSTLATALERMELKLDRVFSNSARFSAGDDLSSDVAIGLQHPRTAFDNAVRAGRADMAANILPRLRSVMPTSDFLFQAAGMVASAGYEIGVSTGLDLLSDDQEHNIGKVRYLISSLVVFYAATDREAEGLERLKPVLDKYLDGAESDEDKAWFCNQLEKLYYGTKNLEEAARWAEEATSLAPEELAYRYNLSMVYEASGDMDRAANAADEYLQNSTAQQDADYLAQAVEVYVKADRPAQAREVFMTLRRLNPQRAAALVMNDDIRTIVAPALSSRLSQFSGVGSADSASSGSSAVATGYGKREVIYQGTVDVASIGMWLCDPVLDP